MFTKNLVDWCGCVHVCEKQGNFLIFSTSLVWICSSLIIVKLTNNHANGDCTAEQLESNGQMNAISKRAG